MGFPPGSVSFQLCRWAGHGACLRLGLVSAIFAEFDVPGGDPETWRPGATCPKPDGRGLQRLGESHFLLGVPPERYVWKRFRCVPGEGSGPGALLVGGTCPSVASGETIDQL